jgi:glycosyltransferase involved in cell wall biosynthesis
VSCVSIAMAARNAERFVKEALDSISPALEGSGMDYEVLLADGQSTDATLAIAATSPKVAIVSRRDGGIYDGMNRAIAAAKGDYLLILNSDDVLLPAVLGRAASLIERNSECDMVSGATLFGSQAETAILRRNDATLSIEGTLFGVPVINARLFRTSFLRRVGTLRTDIGIGADREFLVRVAQRRAKSLHLDEALYFYRSHEGSQTMANTRAGRARVYLADTQIAAHYLNDPATDREVSDLAGALYALAGFKLSLCGQRAPAIPAEAYPNLRDRLRAARLALKWRGRLSGA